MTNKFQGTNPKYRDYTEDQLWQEYARLKREFEQRNRGATVEEYDRFIDRIVDELGI